MRVPPVVLSIAGYDPSSGAGITADIKTAASLGCYAVTCITALTVQSTQGVFGVQPLEPELVARTLEALADDVEIAAVRLGMLGSGAVAAAVAGFLGSRRLPHVVLDPVIRSSSGAALLDAHGGEVLRTRLMPLCAVVTPNVDEAAVLAGAEPIASGTSWDSALPRIREMAAGLHTLGAKAVVITGGHLQSANDYVSTSPRATEAEVPQGLKPRFGATSFGAARSRAPSEPARDVPVGDMASLAYEEIILGERLESRSTHGTGCAFATALACRLALGDTLPEAVRAAKEYVRKAMLAAYPLGKGIGPLNHFG
ncbi:MAG: bifunctional hydroxymethylpyrimidine kinase/phosphomethylpyrimidine kinase [Candidatus Korobacteraceae bacterium]|jgi:hydroxymethylpyrimidine/phosphomethylpyrimidine kinase